jgi:hypothetical protein
VLQYLICGSRSAVFTGRTDMKHVEVPQILSRKSKTYIVHRESPTFKIQKKVRENKNIALI